METINISGIVDTGTIYEDFDTILLIQDDGYKQDMIGRLNEASMNYGNKVSIKYFVAPRKATKDEIITKFLGKIDGTLEINYEANSYSYSEWTHGTDYDTIFSVGSHNLMSELLSYRGQYVIVEASFCQATQKHNKGVNADKTRADADRQLKYW